MEQVETTIRAIQAAEASLREIEDGPRWLLRGDPTEAELRDLIKRFVTLAQGALGAAAYCEWGIEERAARQQRFTHRWTGSTATKEDWIAAYDPEELARRGLTAEGAFVEDEGRTLFPVE